MCDTGEISSAKSAGGSVHIRTLDDIFKHINDAGYHATIHRFGEMVEIRAVPISRMGESKVVRCDGDDYAASLTCARELARMVGIDVDCVN